MVRGIEAALEEIKRDPEKTVTTEIDGQFYEIRRKEPRNAAEFFRSLGPWEGESREELRELFRKARAEGGSKEPPGF